MVEDQFLQIGLARDPERLLEVDEGARVRLGDRGLAAGRGAHAEVDEQPGQDELELANPLAPRGLSGCVRTTGRVWVACVRENAANTHKSSPMKPPLMRNVRSPKPVPASATRAQPGLAELRGSGPWIARAAAKPMATQAVPTTVSST